jgi:hypothetical protein
MHLFFPEGATFKQALEELCCETTIQLLLKITTFKYPLIIAYGISESHSWLSHGVLLIVLA